MAENSSRRDPLKEALILVFLAALIAVVRVVFRLPIKLPGHNMLPIVFLMCLGKALTSRIWAGFFMGCVAGLLSLGLGGGLKSFNVFLNSSLVGLALDGLFLIYNPLTHNRYWALIIWGGLAAIPHNITGIFRDILAGADFFVVMAINIPKTGSGMLFAAIGAALASPLIKALKRQHQLATNIEPVK